MGRDVTVWTARVLISTEQLAEPRLPPAGSRPRAPSAAHASLDMNALVRQPGRIVPAPQLPYHYHRFDVPNGIHQLHVGVAFAPESDAVLFLSIFDAEGRYRGSVMTPKNPQLATLELALADHTSSEGGLPGPIPAGVWWAQLEVYRPGTTPEISYDLQVDGSSEEMSAPKRSVARLNGHPGAGYYRGELHCHSSHSDGSDSVALLAHKARSARLDFLALTDHFTSSGWDELASVSGADLAVIRGIEFTCHGGHATLLGLSEWVDTFVDRGNRTGRTINDVAHDTHRQGGLFGVAHPFAGRLGWRFHEFDWELCDLFEIYDNVGTNSVAQLGYWDHLLNQGYRITGVAATDHHRDTKPSKLGNSVTYIYASELSPAALLEGLRSGRAFVSLGPTLEFRASSGEHSVHMGDTLLAEGTVPGVDRARLHGHGEPVTKRGNVRKTGP